MDRSDYWEIDRLAASQLVSALKCKPSEIDGITLAFTKYRKTISEWIVKKTHDDIAGLLEKESMNYFSHHDAQWIEGYLFAQRVVSEFEMAQDELTGSPAKTTKGDFLRDSIRSVRRIKP